MAKFLKSHSSDTHKTAAPGQDDDDLETVDLETALAPRRLGRHLSRRVVLALAPIITLAALMLYAIFGQSFTSWLQPLSPTGQAPDGQIVAGIPQQFTITSNVSYGSITVNGKQLSGPPPLNVTLPPGYDTITLTAAPFRPRACQVLSQYEPVIVSNGKASVNTASCIIGGSYTASSLYTLYMPLTGDDLPADQLTQVRTVLAQALTRLPVYTTTVPTGEYFATGIDGHGLPIGQRATEPLHGRLFLVLATASTVQDVNPYDCPSHICSAVTLLDPQSASQSRNWRVSVLAGLQWRFATSTGSVVGNVTENAAGPLDFVLADDPQTGWRVITTPPSAPVNEVGSIAHALDPCAVGDNMVTFNLALNQGIEMPPSKPGVTQGCAFQINPDQGATGARFVYRFGVVLAANAAAHSQLPSLPMAPSAEIAAIAP